MVRVPGRTKASLFSELSDYFPRPPALLAPWCAAVRHAQRRRLVPAALGDTYGRPVAVKDQGRFRSASGRAHEKTTRGPSYSRSEPTEHKKRVLELQRRAVAEAAEAAALDDDSDASGDNDDASGDGAAAPARPPPPPASAAAAAIPEPPPRRRRAEDHRRAKGENEGAALRHQILLLAQAGRTS